MGRRSITSRPIHPELSPQRDVGWIPRPEDFAITDDDPVDLKVYEIKAILRALSCVEGNRQEAAQLLGIGKSTLYRRLAEWRAARVESRAQ